MPRVQCLSYHMFQVPIDDTIVPKALTSVLELLAHSDHSPVFGLFKIATHLPKNYLGEDEGEAIVTLENMQLTTSETRWLNICLEIRSPFTKDVSLTPPAPMVPLLPLSMSGI